MCKHCGKEMDEHSFLTCTCPRYSTSGIKIGYNYGHEYEEAEEVSEYPDGHGSYGDMGN